jgi:hypothetical protein
VLVAHGVFGLCCAAAEDTPRQAAAQVSKSRIPLRREALKGQVWRPAELEVGYSRLTARRDNTASELDRLTRTGHVSWLVNKALVATEGAGGRTSRAKHNRIYSSTSSLSDLRPSLFPLSTSPNTSLHIYISIPRYAPSHFTQPWRAPAPPHADLAF